MNLGRARSPSAPNSLNPILHAERVKSAEIIPNYVGKSTEIFTLEKRRSRRYSYFPVRTRRHLKNMVGGAGVPRSGMQRSVAGSKGYSSMVIHGESSGQARRRREQARPTRMSSV